MSKRKHKNKFRFQPPLTRLAAADQQTRLPLDPIDKTLPEAAAATSPVDAIAEAAAAPIPVESAAPTAPDLAPTGTRPSVPAVALDASLGQRLRAAREARGLSCEDAAHALKLPATVLKALEAEQFERIGHGVFLRGYLSKYLQLLDLPQILAERIVQDHAEPPPLTTNGGISHPRYLFERYSGSALYLILTGVIIVPAVLVALRVGFDQNLARITPLDAPPPAVLAPVTPIATAQAQPATQPVAATAAAKPEEIPLAASMTPFAAAAENKPAAVSPAAATATNRLHLSLAQASWVEVVDADGKKLEYGLLPAGSERDYASDEALDIRIGNADGAALTIDGKPQDLALFRHANVAHLKVSDGAAAAGHGTG